VQKEASAPRFLRIAGFLWFALLVAVVLPEDVPELAGRSPCRSQVALSPPEGVSYAKGNRYRKEFDMARPGAVTRSARRSVTLTPEMSQRIADAAAELGLSINAWMSFRLAEAVRAQEAVGVAFAQMGAQAMGLMVEQEYEVEDAD